MSHRAKIFSLVAFLLFLFATLPTPAKVATDFDPTLNFSRYKTFAYLGGTEMLLRMQLNPDQLNNQIHRSVTRELTGKGPVSRMAARKIVLRQLKPANFSLHGQVETAGKRAER